MATDISICSNALLKLGAPAISSFNTASQAAQLCANIWPDTRDSVLRAHPWNCAVKRVHLSPDSTAPAFGYSYQFTIPADNLRVLEVVDVTDYRIETGKLLCDEPSIDLIYIWRNTEISTWDALLVDVMTQRMVAELAWPITKSSTQQVTESNKYTSMLKTAKSVDALEQEQEQFGNAPMLDVRYF